MTDTHAQLIDLRERLLACAEAVPARAESCRRECAGLLGELGAALSWRGLLGRAQSAARLAPRVDALCARAAALVTLFARIGQVEQDLASAAARLDQVAAPALCGPGGLSARLERLGGEVRRLGRQVATDDDLMVDERRCEALQTEAARLADALGLWLAAEAVLARLTSSPRTAALEASLPGLAERLGRVEGLAEWKAELKALLDPLEQLLHRPQPREITETEKIIKALPRWARVLGEAGDACEALAQRFKARRRDWPGEDDRTFEELFEQARALEQDLLERAAAVRRAGLADLEAGRDLFAELVQSDPGLDALVLDLRADAPEDPRDHEDWCLRLREATAAFQHRVKRSENALLATFGDGLDDCRQRLEALGPLPRLAVQDDALGRLRDRFEALGRGAGGGDPLTLLRQVGEVRALRGDLDDLEAAVRRARADLARTASAVRERALWLTEHSRALAVALPVSLPEPGPEPDSEPSLESGAEPDSGTGPPGAPAAPAALEHLRRRLEVRAQALTEAESAFVRAGMAAADAAADQAERLLALIGAERVRAAGLGPDAPPQPAALAPAAVAERLEAERARLAAALALAAEEERDLSAGAAELEAALTAVAPEGLGHQDRADRDAVLRQLADWRTETLEDPGVRLAALADLIEQARHLQRRIAAAARRLEERRGALRERLRRFNARLLAGYVPELYGRVEALALAPAGTGRPRGGEEAQLGEAERLLSHLERAAGRLAARDLGATVAALERRLLRTGDAEARALLEQALALPPEEPPPAQVRRRLADWGADRALETGEGTA